MNIIEEIKSLKAAIRQALRNDDIETANRALEELNFASEEAGASGIGEAHTFALADFE